MANDAFFCNTPLSPKARYWFPTCSYMYTLKIAFQIHVYQSYMYIKTSTSR